MLRQYSLFIILGAMLISAFALGCGSGDSPTAPASSPTLSAESSVENGSNRMLWAFYDVNIDPTANTVEIIPLRLAEFTCNVTKFLQPPSSPTSLISISIQPGTDWPSGYGVLDVSVNHPFIGLEKFRGFDVFGILMAEATQSMQIDPDLIYPVANETYLVNADGYTRWWNQVEFTTFDKILGYTEGSLAVHVFESNSTLNGYKYFADDLGPEDPIYMLTTEDRGSFGVSPGVNTRRYEIQFAMSPVAPNFHFKYAISANWAKPDDQWDPEYPVEAYPPEANCQEAYRIYVVDSGSTAWYVDDSNTGGYVQLDIEVFDWQAPYNPSGILGELAGLWLEGEIVSAPVDLLAGASVVPGGDTSSVFQVEINSLNLSHSGLNDIWIIAQNADPNNYEPQIEGDTSLFDWPDSPLAAYLRTTVDISGIAPQYNPVVIAIDPDEGEVDTVVNATVTGEYFADGCLVELRESDGPMIIQADNEVWIDETEVTCDLDLNGATLGLYDVVVINPSMLEGSLEEGFNVFEVGPEDIIFVDDSNDTGVEDGTMAHPYNTIQEGLDAAIADWQVWVDDSDVDYDEAVILTADVELKSVNWDDSDGDDEATIYHSGTGAIVTGAEGATIDGFKITGGSRLGININGVSTTVKNCHVTDFSNGSSYSYLYGIQVVDSIDTVIENCEISEFHMSASYAPYYGIYMSNSPITVTGTEVHHMTKSGNYNTWIGIHASGCVPQGDKILDIRHCEVHHIYCTGDLGGSYTATYGIYISGSDEADIFNNIAYSITGGNYNTVFGVRINGSTDIEYVNNVIYDVFKNYYFGTAYGLYITTCTDLDVRNSIINRIRRNIHSTVAYGVHADAESTYTFEYNDVYSCSNGNYHGSAAAGTGCISEDPDFIDPGTDFHLDTGSPCIDTGDPAISDPDASQSDMGAYGGPGGDW